MSRTRRAAGALAALVLLGGCDNNEYLFPTQSAGGSGTGGGTFLVSDPSGDLRGTIGEGAPDATAISGSVRGDTIVVTINFRSTISPWSAGRPNSLTGFIDFDLDESVATGIPSAIDEHGGSAGQGVEYYVSLQDEDGGTRVALIDVETQDAFRVPVTFAATSVTVRIPRTMLPDATPGLTISAVVGHQANEATDFVPNTGNVRVKGG